MRTTRRADSEGSQPLPHNEGKKEVPARVLATSDKVEKACKNPIESVKNAFGSLGNKSTQKHTWEIRHE